MFTKLGLIRARHPGPCTCACILAAHQDVQHRLEMMGGVSQTWWADVKRGYRRMKLELLTSRRDEVSTSSVLLDGISSAKTYEVVHYRVEHPISGQKNRHLLGEHKLKEQSYWRKPATNVVKRSRKITKIQSQTGFMLQS